MPFISQLEPAALLAHFMAQPPIGFAAQLSPQGMPCFSGAYPDTVVPAKRVRQRSMATAAAGWQAQQHALNLQLLAAIVVRW